MIHIKHSAKVYCHKRRNKQGDYLILFLRFSMAYHRQDLSLGISVNPDQFDVETGTILNHPNAEELNGIIAKAITCVADIIKHYEVVEKRMPLGSEVREMYTKQFNGIDFKATHKSLTALIDEFCKEGVARKAWEPSTVEKFTALRNNLIEMDPHVKLDKFSDEYMQSIVEWYIKRGYANPTIYKKLGFIRWFLAWCKKNGYYRGNAHETYEVSLKGANYEQKTIVYLEREELTRLETFDFGAKKYLERTRDYFIFSCYCGLRYSDIKALEYSQIYDNSIHSVNIKTEKNTCIEINSHTRRILDKYKAENPKLNAKVFSMPSDQKLNDYIKEACELAGINQLIKLVYFRGDKREEIIVPKYKAISFHAARRTFITMSLLLDIPPTVIIKWTGHTSVDALKPYMAVVDELRRRHMNKFDML